MHAAMLSLFRVLSQSERKAERLSGSSGLSERVSPASPESQEESMLFNVHICSHMFT